MNFKRFIGASLAVFLAGRVLDFLIHGVILNAAYLATKAVWRPDMQSKMWLMWVSGFVVSFLFTYIFGKGYEGKGIMEGARFGLVIGVFVSIPMALNTYATIRIPHTLAVSWLLYGIAEWIVLGIVAASIYRPAQASKSLAAAV